MPQTLSQTTTAPVIEPQNPSPAPAASAPAVEAPAETRPFRWNQLLVTNDYRAFVANLRAAGCPEETVKDIVRGDIERVFAYMRAQRKTDGAEPAPLSVQSQVRMTAYLLDQNLPNLHETLAAVHDQELATKPAPIESFLRETDLTTIGVNDEQKQQIAGLRQNLLEQISRVSAAPGTPTTRSPRANSELQPASIGPANTQSSLTQTDGTLADSPPPPRTAATGPGPWWHPTSKEIFMAEEAQSMVGGIFGIGAATHYDQYHATHQPPQD